MREFFLNHLPSRRWWSSIAIAALTVLSLLIFPSQISHSEINPISDSDVRIPTEPMSLFIPTESDCPKLDKYEQTPRLISIPDAYIENACMESVGVSKDGRLGDPQDSEMNFGYWMDSRVYKSGSVAVYTCHISFNPAKNAICDDLNQLVVGSEIIVESNSGQKRIYIVAETKTLPVYEVDMTEFLTPYDPSKKGLSIMTCAGYYNIQIGDASHRLLIRAVSKG